MSSQTASAICSSRPSCRGFHVSLRELTVKLYNPENKGWFTHNVYVRETLLCRLDCDDVSNFTENDVLAHILLLHNDFSLSSFCQSFHEVDATTIFDLQSWLTFQDGIQDLLENRGESSIKEERMLMRFPFLSIAKTTDALPGRVTVSVHHKIIHARKEMQGCKAQ